MTTMEYLNQSLEEERPVTYAPTRRAQPIDPPTETPILCPNGPPASFGMIALDAWAIE